ncbi:WhiB family transcriptional regulator [Streptomyces sp. NPDC002308]
MTVNGRATTGATRWMKSAACRNKKLELFFPVGERQAADKTARAKKLCASCAVRPECLQWAMDTQQEAGIWGGLDGRERRDRGQERRRSYGLANLPAVQEILNLRIDEFHAAAAKGLSPGLIAKELGTNVQTVNNVFDALANGLVGFEEGAPDEAAVLAYLNGEDSNVSPRDVLAAVVRGVRRGMAFQHFDALHGLNHGTTRTFVTHMQEVFAARGLEFPDFGPRPGLRKLTDEQVVEFRTRAATGRFMDQELAKEAGMDRKAMSNLLTGRTYKNVGGPVRDPKTRQYPPAVVWASGAEAHNADSGRMETAA